MDGFMGFFSLECSDCGMLVPVPDKRVEGDRDVLMPCPDVFPKIGCKDSEKYYGRSSWGGI